MKRFFGFICLLFLAASTLFCVSVDDFLLSKQIVLAENEPLFSGNKITLTADDGAKMVLMQVNSYYTPENEHHKTILDEAAYNDGGCVFWLVKKNGFRSFLLLNETEDVILCKFDDIPSYLTEHVNSIKIEKVKEFENVISYNFTFFQNDYFYQAKSRGFEILDGLEPNFDAYKKSAGVIEYLVWLGKEKHTSISGSFIYPPKEINTKIEGDNPVFENLRDVYYYFVAKEIERCESLISNRVLFEFNYPIIIAKNIVLKVDFEDAQELNERFERMYDKRQEVYRDVSANERIIKEFGYTVNEVQKEITGWCESISISLNKYLNSRESAYVEMRKAPDFQERYDNLLDRNKKFMEMAKSRPNIKGNLPKNDDELTEFLSWRLSVLSALDSKTTQFIDYYGTEVKFELVEDGLKVSSAGYDGKFDTADDFVYVRSFFQ